VVIRIPTAEGVEYINLLPKHFVIDFIVLFYVNDARFIDDVDATILRTPAKILIHSRQKAVAQLL